MLAQRRGQRPHSDARPMQARFVIHGQLMAEENEISEGADEAGARSRHALSEHWNKTRTIR